MAEVRLYRAPRWPDPDGAISDTFLLVRLVREETSAKEGATVLVDRYAARSLAAVAFPRNSLLTFLPPCLPTQPGRSHRRNLLRTVISDWPA